MTETLAAWVRSTAAGAVFCGAVLLLTPEGAHKRAVRLVCTLALLLLLIQPLRTLDTARFSELLSNRKLLETGLTEDTDELSTELCRRLIREKTGEYIWDAAARLGIARLGIRLKLQEGESLPFPWSIELTGAYTPLQQEELSLLLEGELGIPRERQIWSISDAG